MSLEKMIDELYALSKKAIASGIHVSFENRIRWISMPGLGGGTSRKQNDCL